MQTSSERPWRGLPWLYLAVVGVASAIAYANDTIPTLTGLYPGLGIVLIVFSVCTAVSVAAQAAQLSAKRPANPIASGVLGLLVALAAAFLWGRELYFWQNESEATYLILTGLAVGAMLFMSASTAVIKWMRLAGFVGIILWVQGRHAAHETPESFLLHAVALVLTGVGAATAMLLLPSVRHTLAWRIDDDSPGTARWRRVLIAAICMVTAAAPAPIVLERTVWEEQACAGAVVANRPVPATDGTTRELGRLCVYRNGQGSTCFLSIAAPGRGHVDVIIWVQSCSKHEPRYCMGHLLAIQAASGRAAVTFEGTGCLAATTWFRRGGQEIALGHTGLNRKPLYHDKELAVPDYCR